MSDMQSSDWVAFVSQCGHIIGVGKANEHSLHPKEGTAVAILRLPTTLLDWLDVLSDTDDLDHAVRTMVECYEGERVSRTMDLSKSTFVPFYPIFGHTVVGEA